MIRTLTLLWRLGLPSLRRVPDGGPAPGTRRDPAPTLWSYRYQRLMLTPTYRRALRLGLPCALAGLAGAFWLADAGHRGLVTATWEGALDRVRERPEFMVAAVEVRGADRALTLAVDDLLGLDLPRSSFDLDLDAIRAQVATLSAVRSAAVRVRQGGAAGSGAGGILEVAVDQRRPLAVWRHADGLRLVDADGVMTGMIASRADRSDLPLIAGDGARDAIGEALALFEAASPIAPRVRGLVRMGERRWDVVLDGEGRILLPTVGAEAALSRVVALHQAEELLDRDVSVVDMRLGDRPTIRIGQPALNVLRTQATVAADESDPAAPLPLEEN